MLKLASLVWAVSRTSRDKHPLPKFRNTFCSDQCFFLRIITILQSLLGTPFQLFLHKGVFVGTKYSHQYFYEEVQPESIAFWKDLSDNGSECCRDEKPLAALVVIHPSPPKHQGGIFLNHSFLQHTKSGGAGSTHPSIYGLSTAPRRLISTTGNPLLPGSP